MPKIVFIVCLFLSTLVLADVSVDQVKEIKYLLDFVKNSGCSINRNGTDYPAVKGVEHIQKKYDYFSSEINNTEDFIEYAATKSTMSGKYYMVTCPGEKTINTRDWLLTELKRFRSDAD